MSALNTQRLAALLTRGARLVLIAAFATACGGGGGNGEVTPPAQPVSLAITGVPFLAMVPGQLAQLTATLTYSDASTRDVTATTTWSTTDTTVLSVSPAALIVALAPGQAEVIASTQGLDSRGGVRISPIGPSLAFLAGSLQGAGNVDGTRTGARFYGPSGLATDRAGNTYVADTRNHTIRKITPDGVVTTLAGAAGQSGSADGPGAEARFNAPFGVATDSAGTVYVSDAGNFTIRRISPARFVTTLAGTAGQAGSTDGVGAEARFGSCWKDLVTGTVSCHIPGGIATDPAGNVYVADDPNLSIRKVTPAGVVSTLAGPIGFCWASGGVSRYCRGPTALATDDAGNVYVASPVNSTVMKVTPAGMVTTLAGRAGEGGSTDGIGAEARFGACGWDVNRTFRICSGLAGVATDSAANVYVSDAFNSNVRKITPQGMVTTLAGGARQPGSADGFGAAARFNAAAGVATDNVGNVYVADTGGQTIRKVTPVGMVTTLAGAAGQSGSADGIGTEARFGSPRSVATDSDGNIYVADYSTSRRITPAGVVTTLAGTAGQSGSADSVGADARFSFEAAGVATDSAGNVYVADTGNHTIRRITPAGVVTTLAGTAGQPGSADGTGADARFGSPRSVATDSAGNVYVADTGNHTIRRITPAGAVTTLAGTAGQSGSADGIGTVARFSSPLSVATDSAGNVYVADTGNHTIRKIARTGVVTTVVGVAGLTGFVPGALPSVLAGPRGIALSGTSLYITLYDGVAVVNNVP